MKNQTFFRIASLISIPLLLGAGSLSAAPAKSAKPSVKATAAHPARRAAVPATTEQTPLQKQMGALKSPDVNQRRQAVEELSRLKDPHAVPALIIALSDEDALVRSGAARTLGLMRSGDGVKELSRLAKDDPEAQVRQSAAVALGFIGDASGADALIKNLKDDSPGVRFAACQALANMKAVSAVPALRESLADPSPQFRRMAVAALGDLGDASAAPDLRPLVKEKDASIQAAALVALGKLKDQDSVPVMKKLLSKKTPAEARVAAAQGLAEMGNAAGQDAALDVLKDKAADMRLRVQAVQALNIMPEPQRRLGALKSILADEPEGPVKQAVSSAVDRASAPQ